MQMSGTVLKMYLIACFSFKPGSSQGSWVASGCLFSVLGEAKTYVCNSVTQCMCDTVNMWTKSNGTSGKAKCSGFCRGHNLGVGGDESAIHQGH